MSMNDLDEMFAGFPAMLNREDDPQAWKAVIAVLLEEFSFRHAKIEEGTESFLQIGACSHWFRPHQSRWTAAGGFAWPIGYGGAQGFLHRGLPEFDWSVTFQRARGKWQPVGRFAGKKKLLVRVAIPAGTTRHKQAAVHTLWQPENKVIFYGFRNLSDGWTCVANSEELVSALKEKGIERKRKKVKSN
jgi:hypothetical protein